MVKKGIIGILVLILTMGIASVAFAEDGGAKAASVWIYFAVAIASGFGIGVAAMGVGIGMGNAINGALQGTARNPEASTKIMVNMIIGLALAEALCIYALLISLMLAGKIPSLEKFLGA